MPAYWIGRTKIIDPALAVQYARLGERMESVRKEHPYRTLVRGGAFGVIEGEQYFDRFVVHEFPSIEAAAAFYESPFAQEAAALRARASGGRSDLVVVEGV